MKRLAARTVVLWLLTTPFLILGPASAEPPKRADTPAAGAGVLARADDLEIRKVVVTVEEAWNAHDMGAFGKLLRADAEWVNIVGMHWRGRDAVVAAHAAFHETMFKNHRVKTDSIETRPLGRDSAIAVVTTTNDAFTTPAGQVMPKAQNRQTYVLAKGPEGWRIAHAQNVVVNPEAERHDPTKPRRE